jgi:DNA-binding XRE family transcriptional regulator
MPDLKFLPSIRNSETITCKRCFCAQYPRNGVCVRCGQPLERDYVNLQIDADLEVSKEHLAQLVGALLRNMRKRRGIGQSQLAKRAAGSISRTSLSKAECGRMLLPLHKLLLLTKALGLTAIILRFDGAAIRAVHKSDDQH